MEKSGPVRGQTRFSISLPQAAGLSNSSITTPYITSFPAIPAIPISLPRMIPLRDSNGSAAVTPVIPIPGVGPSHIEVDDPPRCAFPRKQNPEQQSTFVSTPQRQVMVRKVSAKEGGRRKYPKQRIGWNHQRDCFHKTPGTCNVGCNPLGRVSCVDAPFVQFSVGSRIRSVGDRTHYSSRS